MFSYPLSAAILALSGWGTAVPMPDYVCEAQNGTFETFDMLGSEGGFRMAGKVTIDSADDVETEWMPFAGARTSGHGVGGIPYTVHEMQTEKMMVWRSSALD